MSLLKPSTKALALSCKVSVRTDNRGFLSLQYLVRNDDGQICFVEYYCCPDEEVEENWEHQIQIWLVISTLTTHQSPVCQRRQVWRKCRTCNGHSGVNRKWTDSSFARFERNRCCACDLLLMFLCSLITPHVIIVARCAAGVYRDMFDVCSSTLLITMVTQLFSVTSLTICECYSWIWVYLLNAALFIFAYQSSSFDICFQMADSL